VEKQKKQKLKCISAEAEAVEKTEDEDLRGVPRYDSAFLISNFDLLFTDISMLASAQHKLIEGSLEVELPTIWTDEKQSREEADKRERFEERRSEERRSEKRKSQQKEDADARKR